MCNVLKVNQHFTDFAPRPGRPPLRNSSSTRLFIDCSPRCSPIDASAIIVALLADSLNLTQRIMSDRRGAGCGTLPKQMVLSDTRDLPSRLDHIICMHLQHKDGPSPSRANAPYPVAGPRTMSGSGPPGRSSATDVGGRNSQVLVLTQESEPPSWASRSGARNRDGTSKLCHPPADPDTCELHSDPQTPRFR